MTDKLHRGEPADASGLPFGTENPANTTVPDDADAPARNEQAKQPTGDPTLGNRENQTGVESPAQGTGGHAPPSYTGETGDGGPQTEELERRSVYERGPQ